MTTPNKPHTRPPRSVAAPARSAPPPARVPLRLLLRVSSIAGGIQFGWALQLSLLTPYVQELGIPHAWSSLVWLCGPLSGLIVQPLVGHVSDKSQSRFGRRRPFMVGGAATIALAVLLVGHSSDIGWLLGDRDGRIRSRAIGVFVVGFWLLDVGNNATQSPCRALLADITGKDHRRTRVANAYFSLFMALGNVLGFASGSYSGWYKLLPFTITKACSVNCANLKSAFLIDIVLLAITTYVSVSSAKEVPLSSGSSNTHSAEEAEHFHSGPEEAFLWELMGAFRHLTLPIWTILIVTSLTWIGWFPFVQFDTDWMGREIYHGDPNVGQNYHSGVRMGAFGLMLQSIVLGFTSVAMEKMCKKWGAGLVWGISNLVMFLCFVAMLITAFVASKIKYTSEGLPPDGIIIAAIVVFTILGAPLAVTYSIPYAMISSRIEPLGLGQGLAMGILNLAIVIPQMLVSLGSGPWDQLFGGGNSPAFAVAAVSSFVSGLVATIALPRSSPTPRSSITRRRERR